MNSRDLLTLHSPGITQMASPRLLIQLHLQCPAREHYATVHLGRAASETQPNPQLVISDVTLWVEAAGLWVHLRLPIWANRRMSPCLRRQNATPF
jgi:hypothetical protein